MSSSDTAAPPPSKPGKSKKGTTTPPSSGGSFADELKAAFIWTNLSDAERKAFRKQYPVTALAIIENSPPGSLEYDKFTERSSKKNFAENLSRHIASRFADALSHDFTGILPSPDGKGHESKARTSKGYKKLDVNYSTPELGLGLGVSIKTINAVDAKSKRYTKNYTRVDAELRAEAADYHERQPYSTMVAVIFLPLAACSDASERDPSSFGAAVRLFRNRAGRQGPTDSGMLFERVFLGLYDTSPETLGDVVFVDVLWPPPWSGKPLSVLSFDGVIREIVDEYDTRNNPRFTWADKGADKSTTPDEEPESELEEGD